MGARDLQWLLWCGLLTGSAAIAGEPGRPWQQGNGYRSAPLVVPSFGKTGFTALLATDLGITFTNQLSEARYTTNQIYLNGSGVAAGDVDGDADADAGADGGPPLEVPEPFLPWNGYRTGAPLVVYPLVRLGQRVRRTTRRSQEQLEELKIRLEQKVGPNMASSLTSTCLC
jgi:hypothetical protein